VLTGGSGNDVLSGGAGSDRFDAGPGDDDVQARDGAAETIDCGAGNDLAVGDAVDRVVGCERVRR
jgi:Ca2+-binding RTX toxin-like protein